MNLHNKIKEKIARTKDDLFDQLRKQFKFLSSSLESFNRGDADEIPRMATYIRTLMHITQNSTGLLYQVDPYMQLIDTSRPLMQPNQSPNQYLSIFCSGLVTLSLPQGWKLTPSPKQRLVNLEEWWNCILFKENNNDFTRKKIVLWIADTDGGAHVDPSLPKDYYQMSRTGSTMMEFFSENGQYYPAGPEQLIIPYISLELLHSLHAAFPEICRPHKLPPLELYHTK